MTTVASIIVRTYNEERYLDQLLDAVHDQQVDGTEVEIVLVDSGSTDRTLRIAERHRCRIAHIAKEEFSFGRSLNLGCSTAKGDYLVFISGHCIPADRNWLTNLLAPLAARTVAYAYGRQIGGPSSKFSEHLLFAKYFPETSAIPQEGFFCNNANAALRRDAWQLRRFDEELPGLEDMYLAKELVRAGEKIGYVADAVVHHHHNETWAQVKRRYEREAIALQHIMPEVQITPADFVRYVASGILLDLGVALQQRAAGRHFAEIVAFRTMQFLGSYRGNHMHRRLSKRRKESYFYPR